MTDTITRLNPAALPDVSAICYSQIVTVEPGRLAFVSGQVGADKDGTVPDSLAQQAENVAARQALVGPFRAAHAQCVEADAAHAQCVEAVAKVRARVRAIAALRARA